MVPHKLGNYRKEYIGIGLKILAKNLNPVSYEPHEILESIRPTPWAYNLSDLEKSLSMFYCYSY